MTCAPATGSARRIVMSVAVLVGAFVLVKATIGCGKAKVLAPTPADPWRREIADKDRQIAALEARVGELEDALANRAAGGDASEVPESAIPRVAGIRLGRQTGIDPDNPRLLRVWVEPFDGRQRFIQLAGNVTVEAAVPGGDGRVADGSQRFGAAFEPLAVRDAWRNGFMGGAYAFDVPVPEGIDIPASTARAVKVVVTVKVAPSGRTLTASWPEEHE